MSKKRKTVTLDPEVKAYLDTEGRNASETVNKLVKMEMGGEAVNKELIRMRMEMEEDRYQEAAQKARGHLERYNQLNDRISEIEEEEQNHRKEAFDLLKNVPWKPDNPAIQTNADDLDMTPEELIAELEDYHAE